MTAYEDAYETLNSVQETIGTTRNGVTVELSTDQLLTVALIQSNLAIVEQLQTGIRQDTSRRINWTGYGPK